MAPSSNRGFQKAEEIDIDRLRLDPLNPRLELGESGARLDQGALAELIADTENALVVAQSIARNGFYPWEVLVVVPQGDEFIVVEGNRRLTALIGLRDPSARSRFSESTRWETVAHEMGGELPTTVPCVVVSSRSEAQPALGYRHISGIEPWRPIAQAQFIAKLVDEDGLTTAAISELTGKTTQWVESTYRNLSVLRQAEAAGFDSVDAKDAFSLVDVALSRREIKSFIGLTRDGRETRDAAQPVPDEQLSELVEVFTYIFGAEAEGVEPKITESRDITRLGKVIVNPEGLKRLRDGESIDEAELSIADAGKSPIERVIAEIHALTGRASKAADLLHELTVKEEPSDDVVSAIETFKMEAVRVIQFIDYP